MGGLIDPRRLAHEARRLPAAEPTAKTPYQFSMRRMFMVVTWFCVTAWLVSFAVRRETNVRAVNLIVLVASFGSVGAGIGAFSRRGIEGSLLAILLALALTALNPSPAVEIIEPRAFTPIAACAALGAGRRCAAEQSVCASLSVSVALPVAQPVGESNGVVPARKNHRAVPAPTGPPAPNLAIGSLGNDVVDLRYDYAASSGVGYVDFFGSVNHLTTPTELWTASGKNLLNLTGQPWLIAQTTVPEPNAAMLLGIGFVTMCGLRLLRNFKMRRIASK